MAVEAAAGSREAEALDAAATTTTTTTTEAVAAVAFGSPTIHRSSRATLPNNSTTIPIRTDTTILPCSNSSSRIMRHRRKDSVPWAALPLRPLCRPRLAKRSPSSSRYVRIRSLSTCLEQNSLDLQDKNGNVIDLSNAAPKKEAPAAAAPVAPPPSDAGSKLLQAALERVEKDEETEEKAEEAARKQAEEKAAAEKAAAEKAAAEKAAAEKEAAEKAAAEKAAAEKAAAEKAAAEKAAAEKAAAEKAAAEAPKRTLADLVQQAPPAKPVTIQATKSSLGRTIYTKSALLQYVWMVGYHPVLFCSHILTRFVSQIPESRTLYDPTLDASRFHYY